ncbi:MAG: hypothetical protein AB1467_01645 [Candidatus Diapherotrites archaeon]
MKKFLALAVILIFALSGAQAYNFAVQDINANPDGVFNDTGGTPTFTKNTTNSMKVTIRASYNWWDDAMTFNDLGNEKIPKEFRDNYPKLLQECYLEALPSGYPITNIIYKQGEPICNPGRPDHPEIPDYNCIVDINVSHTINASVSGNITYSVVGIGSAAGVGLCGQQKASQSISTLVSFIDPVGPTIDFKTWWGIPNQTIDINANASSLAGFDGSTQLPVWLIDSDCIETSRSPSPVPSANDVNFVLRIYCKSTGSKIVKARVYDKSGNSRTATGIVQIVGNSDQNIDVNGFGPYYGNCWEDNGGNCISGNTTTVKTEVFALNPSRDSPTTNINTSWGYTADCGSVAPFMAFCGNECVGAFDNFYYRLGSKIGIYDSAIEMIGCETGSYDINFNVSSPYGNKKYTAKFYVPRIDFYFPKYNLYSFIGEPLTITGTIKNYAREMVSLTYAYSKIYGVAGFSDPQCTRIGSDFITKNQDNNEWSLTAQYMCNKAGKGSLRIIIFTDKTADFGRIFEDQPGYNVYIDINYNEVLRMNSFTITPESVQKGQLVNFTANVQNLDSNKHNIKVTLEIYDENNVKKTGPHSKFINNVAAGNAVDFVFNDFNTSNLDAKQNYRVVATAYFDDGTGNYVLDAKPVNNTMTRYFYVSQAQATAPEANYWTIVVVLIAVSVVVLRSKQRQ